MAKKSFTPVAEAKEQTKRRGRPPGVNAAKKPEPKPSEYQSFYDAFAAKLRELMEERHESQNSLGHTIAEMTNCKGSMQSVVHRWFHAKGMPRSPIGPAASAQRYTTRINSTYRISY